MVAGQEVKVKTSIWDPAQEAKKLFQVRGDRPLTGVGGEIEIGIDFLVVADEYCQIS